MNELGSSLIVDISGDPAYWAFRFEGVGCRASKLKNMKRISIEASMIKIECWFHEECRLPDLDPPKRVHWRRQNPELCLLLVKAISALQSWWSVTCLFEMVFRELIIGWDVEGKLTRPQWIQLWCSFYLNWSPLISKYRSLPRHRASSVIKPGCWFH